MTVELGLGAAEALALPGPGRGRVVGVFAKAAYLRLPGGLFALTTFDVPAGPIHARTTVPFGRLRVGDQVTVMDSTVRAASGVRAMQAGPVLVDLSDASVWRGSLPTAAELSAATALAIELLASAPPSSLDAPPDPELLRRGDLRALASRLGGLGPGLTPAGDDCLAGILLIATVWWGAAAADDLATIADAVTTNEIALAFLRWAARGQSIEPVHRFLVAAAEGDDTAARHALHAVVGFGHSSGADLAAGLRAAMQWLCNGVGAR